MASWHDPYKKQGCLPRCLAGGEGIYATIYKKSYATNL